MGFLGGRGASSARKLAFQKAEDFLRQFLDAERFCNMGKTVLREEIVGLLGDYVSGHKQEPFLKGIPRVRQGLIEMLAVKSGHFHVANHQVERLALRAIECFASVPKHIDVQTLILEHIGNQPGHGGLVFDHQHAGSAMAGAQRPLRQSMRTMTLNCRTTVNRQKLPVRIPGAATRLDGGLDSGRKFESESGAALRRTRYTHLAAVFTHDAEHDGKSKTRAYAGGLGGKEG